MEETVESIGGLIDRAGNAPPSLAIRAVILTIKSRGSPIFLADGMYMNGVAEHLHIPCANLRIKDSRRGAPAGKCIIDDGFRRRFR